MIGKLLASKFAPYGVAIASILVVGLGLSTYVLFNFYTSEKALTAQLEQRVEAQQETITGLNLKIVNERENRKDLDVATALIDTKYKELENETNAIPLNPDVPSLDPRAVAELMCRNGLADAGACEQALR